MHKKIATRLVQVGFNIFARIYNTCRAAPLTPYEQTDLKEWNEVIEKSQKLSDICDHLPTLFTEAMNVHPRLIVELGVRGGESTFVLERVARLHQAQLISVDIADCRRASDYPRWHFIQKDDIAFAKEFSTWCKTMDIEPNINVLFIDTSHEFKHTLQELESWFPLLSDRAVVMLHDTNPRTFCFMKGGRLYPVLNRGHHRAVIHALEVFFNRTFNEQIAFTDLIDDWTIQHVPYC